MRALSVPIEVIEAYACSPRAGSLEDAMITAEYKPAVNSVCVPSALACDGVPLFTIWVFEVSICDLQSFPPLDFCFQDTFDSEKVRNCIDPFCIDY
jgi:hypothetical protein